MAWDINCIGEAQFSGNFHTSNIINAYYSVINRKFSQVTGAIIAAYSVSLSYHIVKSNSTAESRSGRNNFYECDAKPQGSRFRKITAPWKVNTATQEGTAVDSKEEIFLSAWPSVRRGRLDASLRFPHIFHGKHEQQKLKFFSWSLHDYTVHGFVMCKGPSIHLTRCLRTLRARRALVRAKPSIKDVLLPCAHGPSRAASLMLPM